MKFSPLEYLVRWVLRVPKNAPGVWEILFPKNKEDGEYHDK